MSLHEGQKKFIRQTQKLNKKVNILTCANRYGKAQPLSEPILTPNGYIPMGEISVGSDVIGMDGKIAKVTEIFPQGIIKTFRFNFSDGSFTRASENHLWTVMTGMSRFKKTIRGKDYDDYKKWKVMSTRELLDKWYSGGAYNGFNHSFVEHGYVLTLIALS